MNKLFLALILTLTIGLKSFSQEDCITPNIRTTFEQKFKEIGVSDPFWLKQEATVISYKSFLPRIQWFGLYWEGPISGALLAYDCKGNLLSICQTGGIRSIKFFNAPGNVGAAIAVEEIGTGTGYYAIQYTIYSLMNGKIEKLWEHLKFESVFVIPWEDGVVDSFEFKFSGPPEKLWEKMIVEGVRKVYPASAPEKFYADFHVEKLPTEFYYWDYNKKTYLPRKEEKKNHP